MMKSLQAHVLRRRRLKVGKGSPNVLVKGRVFTLRLVLLAGTDFSVLVVCCIWQVLILALFYD